MPIAEITPATAIHQVPAWNSLTHIEFVVGIEETFHIQLTQEEIVSMTSVAETERVLKDRGIIS